jgi:hypothetical protein
MSTVPHGFIFVSVASTVTRKSNYCRKKAQLTLVHEPIASCLAQLAVQPSAEPEKAIRAACGCSPNRTVEKAVLFPFLSVRFSATKK